MEANYGGLIGAGVIQFKLTRTVQKKQFIVNIHMLFGQHLTKTSGESPAMRMRVYVVGVPSDPADAHVFRHESSYT